MTLFLNQLLNYMSLIIKLLLSLNCACAYPHQFVGVFRPRQVADLGAGVGALQRLTRQSVPEAQAAVGGAAPRHEQPVLVGGPGDGLHCGQVVTVLLHREKAGAVPHQQLGRRRQGMGNVSPGSRSLVMELTLKMNAHFKLSPCCRCLRMRDAGGQETI